jgi:raffinose/stachyose/melibiose transport system substrate-binding protein
MAHPHPSIPRLIILLLAMTTLLAGCGATTGAVGTTRVLHIWYSTDDPVERVWSQQLARRFEASHPSVHVQLTDYSFEDLNTKLQLALAAGDPPDLAYVTPRGPGIPAYVANHKLLNLAVAARDNRWAERLRPGLLSSYNRVFRFYGASPGAVVAVPTALAAVGVLYNTRLLQALHLQVPRSLASFQRDLRIAKRAGDVPVGIGNGDGWLGDDWYLTLVNAAISAAQLQPEQQLSPHFSFKQAPFLRAGSILQHWSQRGYLTPDFGGLDAQEGIDQFFHGKTLFQLVSSSEDSQIGQDERETRIPVGVFAFPTNGGRPVMPQSGYLGWVVPQDGHNHATAVAFINNLLTPATGRFLVRQGIIPAQAGSRTAASARSSWLRQYLRALNTARPGVYIDAAPIANLNGTMEANVQLLLQGYEQPAFLVKSLQQVYTSRGRHGSTARIDGEF